MPNQQLARWIHAGVGTRNSVNPQGCLSGTNPCVDVRRFADFERVDVFHDRIAPLWRGLVRSCRNFSDFSNGGLLRDQSCFTFICRDDARELLASKHRLRKLRRLSVFLLNVFVRRGAFIITAEFMVIGTVGAGFPGAVNSEDLS